MPDDASVLDADDRAAARVREEVRAWLSANWDGVGADRRAWLQSVIESGWAAPSWPTAHHGRDLAPALGRVVDEEFAAVGAYGTGQDKVNLWANTVLAFGSDDLKAEFIQPLMLGEVNMCLLYSEPGAGSDLAGIRTRAVRDGDEWIIDGQKVWTSGGRQADYALLIARTDWDAPKHKGITFFFLPMKQEGVEVRALRQATGDSRFNEVFLTGARVSNGNVLGAENDGWRVLQTALAYERIAMGQALARRPATDGGADARTDAVRNADDERPAPVPDLSLVDLGRATGRTEDPVTVQRLMALMAKRKVNDWNGARAKAALENGTSSPTASLGKLAMSDILHTAGSLQTEILGAEGTIGGLDSPRSADATYSLLNAFFTSIGGGTDQIQRNIIGERLLGLPKEPSVDRDLPFRDVASSATNTDPSNRSPRD